MSLVVVGSMAFDALETPFGKTDKIVGDAATYISLSSSYFVKPVNVVSVVGGDFDQDHIALMHERNISTEGVQVKENEKSFFWSGRYFNGRKLEQNLQHLLQLLAPSETITLTLFREKQLRQIILTPTAHTFYPKYNIEKRPDAKTIEKANFKLWLHQEFGA